MLYSYFCHDMNLFGAFVTFFDWWFRFAWRSCLELYELCTSHLSFSHISWDPTANCARSFADIARPWSVISSNSCWTWSPLSGPTRVKDLDFLCSCSPILDELLACHFGSLHVSCNPTSVCTRSSSKMTRSTSVISSSIFGAGSPRGRKTPDKSISGPSTSALFLIERVFLVWSCLLDSKNWT